jgi:hypothetical protein
MLTVELGKELKQAWMQCCRARGARAGPAIAALVQADLERHAALPRRGEANPAFGAVRFTVAPRPDERERVRHEISLTPSEDAAANKAAKDCGLALTAWIVAAVRAALTGLPTYGQHELTALTDSSRLVTGLILDIAMWRRAGVPETLDGRFAMLEAELRQHVQAVQALLAAGTRRWEIVP